MSVKGKIWSILWPSTDSIETARNAAIQGVMAAILSTIITVLAVFIQQYIFPERVWGVDFEILDLVEIIPNLLIAYGIYRMSRLAAVIGLWVVIITMMDLFLLEGTPFGFIAFLFLMAFINSVRGTYAFKRYEKEAGIHKPVAKWVYFVGVIVCSFMILVLIIVLFEGMGIAPPMDVIAGEDLSVYNKEYLLEKKILNAGEEILFFYSTGLLSIKPEGNIMTNRRVVSYTQTDDGMEVYSAEFEKIVKFELEKGSWIDNSVLTIWTVDDDGFLLYLSTEDNKDEDFVNALRGKINNPAGFIDEQMVFDNKYKDPDELAVSNQMDFKYFSLECSGPYLVDVEIGFYSDPELNRDYFIYVSADDDHLPEYNIRINEELFSVAREIKPGWYADYKYSGSPEVENDTHRISIPWELAIESRSDYLIYCYTTEGKDRIPNEGSLLFDRDSCTISYISAADLEKLFPVLE